VQRGTPRRVGYLLEQFNNGAPNLAALYPLECLDKPQGIGGIEEIKYIAIASSIMACAVSAAKKEQDRHFQNLRNLLQPGGFDAVVSGFILLDLLGCHPESKGQRLRRQAELKSPQFEALANIFVSKR
jgi:hypothetical protein